MGDSHIYLDASRMLEQLVADGLSLRIALAEVHKRFVLTQGERELIIWAYNERRKTGIVKPIR